MKASIPAVSLEAYAFEHCALISASAGTGKTYTITRLILKLLLGSGRRDPLPLENILVVTFTNAATSDLVDRIRSRVRKMRVAVAKLIHQAGEANEPDTLGQRLAELTLDEDLKAMLRAKIEDSVGDPQVLSLCYRVLLHAERSIDRAPICTIHSFCNRALNQIYAFEAGQAFNTELSEDLTELSHEAAATLYRELLYRSADEVRELCAYLLEQRFFSEQEQYSQGEGSFKLAPIAKLLTEVRTTVESRAYFGYRVCGMKPRKSSQKQLSALKVEILSSVREFADARLELVRQISSRFADFLQQHGLDCADLVAEGGSPGPLWGEQVSFYAGVGVVLEDLRHLMIAPQELSPEDLLLGVKKLTAQTAYKKRALLKTKVTVEHQVVLEEFCRLVYGYVEDLLEYERKKEQLSESLRLKLAVLYLEKFEQLCRRDGVMSNDDLLFKLNKVLSGQLTSGRQTLCNMLRHRYPVAMIDEFQDTDPLQLSIFKQLYLTPEAAHSGAVCCFIGDPKQSIYGFRGADINSYLYAQTLISDPLLGGQIYHLPANYRSAPQLVAAINAVFNHTLNPDNLSPFGAGIAFEDVKSANPQALSFYFADTEQPSEHKPLFYVNQISQIHPLNKGEASAVQAEACARTILHCLKSGRLCEQGRERGVQSSDLCVLVRTRSEADQIREVLAAHKVRSVFFSDHESVLRTGSATEIGYLLSALCNPSDPRRVIRLLSSPLLSLTPEEFFDSLGDARLSQEMDLLTECRKIWQQTGFLSAFEHYLTSPLHPLLQTLRGYEDGERHLTDLYQLSELIQTRHLKQRSLTSQLNWYLNYQQECTEEHLKRLESEVAQVKIYTEHSSKGLEFEVVLLPFICSKQQCRDLKPLLLHAQTAPGEPGERVLCLDPSAADLKAYHEEQALEEMRLLYVALTRAKRALFIYPAEFKSRADDRPSAMTRLWAGLGAVPEDLKKPYFTSEQYPQSLSGPEEVVGPEQQELAAAEFKRAFVNRNFRVSSYSAMTSGLHDMKLPKLEGDLSEELSGGEGKAETLPDFELSAFDFARGTLAGTFLHLLLEKCRFELLNSQVTEALGESLRLCDYARYNRLLLNWCPQEGVALEGLKLWLLEISHAPLYNLRGEAISLASLRSGDYLAELNFTFPVREVKTQSLNDQICIPQAREVVGEDLAGSLSLNEQQLQGYLTGQIDLFCALPGAQGRQYYVIDYKSTHLGNRYADYQLPALRRSVFSPQNRYDVQFLIYTLAAHRYLGSKLEHYEYERDFGGVMYLYLRGLTTRSEQSPGIFFIKPRYEYIEMLDEMFEGRGVSA